MIEPQQERPLIDTDLMQILNSASAAANYNAFARAMSSAAKWLWGKPEEGARTARQKITGGMVLIALVTSLVMLLILSIREAPWWSYFIGCCLLTITYPLTLSAPKDSGVHRIMKQIDSAVDHVLPIFFLILLTSITVLFLFIFFNWNSHNASSLNTIFRITLEITLLGSAAGGVAWLLKRGMPWLNIDNTLPYSAAYRYEQSTVIVSGALILSISLLYHTLSDVHNNQCIETLPPWLAVAGYATALSTICGVIFSYLVNSWINLPKAAAATSNQLNTAIADYLALLLTPHTIDSKQLTKQALSFDLILGNDLLGRGNRQTPVAPPRIRIALLACADAIANSSRKPYVTPTAESAVNFADNPPVHNLLLRNRIRDIVDADKNLWARGNRKYRELFFERQTQVINAVQTISRGEQIEHLQQFLTALERELNQCPRRRKQQHKARR